MEEEQRRLSIDSWWELFTVGRENIQPEDKYFQLLDAADDMERSQLITSDEWRRFIRQANVCLGGHSEGSDLMGMIKSTRDAEGSQSDGNTD